MPSNRFVLNADDAWKTVRTLGVSLAATLLTATAQWITATDWGPWSFIAIPALTGAVEAARRWLSGPPEPAY